MKIDALEFNLFEIPFKRPFKAGCGTFDQKRSVLMKIQADGYVGYGECSALQAPFYSSECADTEYLIAEKFLAPHLVGQSFESPEELARSMNILVKGHPFAKQGIECAFWDAWSKQQGRSVQQLLGGTRTEVEVGDSIGIKSVAETILEVERSLERGFRRIKVKISPGSDYEVLSVIRDQFGDIPLQVDANSSYTLAHLEDLKRLDDFNLLLIEQPLAHDDIIDHATLQKELKTPICLDESILSREDARKAIDIGACKIINIKPGRVGGLVEAKKIHDYCYERGVAVWLGGMIETSVARYFNLALASLPGFLFPADCFPPAEIFNDEIVVRPLTVTNGLTKVPQKLEEYQLDEDKLAHYTVSKVELPAPDIAQLRMPSRAQELRP